MSCVEDPCLGGPVGLHTRGVSVSATVRGYVPVEEMETSLFSLVHSD